MKITHYYVQLLKEKNLKGCITFTSSPANIIPSPLSCFYGATKALITHFATSLACELGPDGIDVSVIHPSPVATNFYTGTHALPTLKLFQGTATGPDRVADCLIRGIGRNIIIDQGYYPMMFRLLHRFLEPVAFCEIMGKIAGNLGDYKYLKSVSGKNTKENNTSTSTKSDNKKDK